MRGSKLSSGGKTMDYGYSVRYLPFIGRGFTKKRGYGYGSEEFIFETRAEAVVFWRRLRHERRGEKLELLKVGPRYSRYTLATWDPKPRRGD